MQTILRTLPAAILLASLADPAARAQDALGAGNALQRDTRHSQPNRTSNFGVLDANTRVGALGDNGQAAKVDYYSRNLIVTGDVAGGRGFRGSVGYREQSEFTGQTGSDDLRRYNAYSVYSSPYMQQANYNPLQASQNFGAIMYTRTYANASARDILTNQQPLDARIAFDRFTADAGKKMKRQADIIDPANTRDTSERLNWRVTQAISKASDRGEREQRQLDDQLANMGLSTYDRQRLREDILRGRTSRDLVGEPLASTSLLPGTSASEDARIRPTLAPEYSTIYSSIRERAGTRFPSEKPEATDAAREKELGKKVDGDMDWLRGELLESGVESGPRRGAKAPSMKDGGGKQPAGGEKAGEAKPGEAAPPNIDDLAYILRHGRKLQSLVPEDSSAIKDMMQLGAAAMSSGEFFRAEERFASVLAVLPNNASALAGVANAQLAAGLPVSGALSLRKLFAMHPEMIDTHLGPDILPPQARLDSALSTARDRLAAANAPSASGDLKSDRFDFGLVISYLGYQTDQPSVVREGLDAMRAARPDDTMVDLLQRVWLPAAEPTRPASPSVR